MGLVWSDEEKEKEREDAAAEEMHELVWDASRAIGKEKIKGILDRHQLTSLPAVTNLREAMWKAEHDQHAKANTYMKNGAREWRDFHHNIAERYKCVSRLLIGLIFPNYVSQYELMTGEKADDLPAGL